MSLGLIVRSQIRFADGEYRLLHTSYEEVVEGWNAGSPFEVIDQWGERVTVNPQFISSVGRHR